MTPEFSHGLSLYRVRYGDGVVTSMLAQTPEYARYVAEHNRPGSEVVDVAQVPSRP
jgi:hypothetical protein